MLPAQATLWELLRESFVQQPALFTGAVALVVFVLTQIINLIIRWVDYRRELKTLVQALYAEILFNAHDLRVFIDSFDDMDGLKRRIANKQTEIPHIADARHTIIYETNIHKMGGLDPEIIPQMVQFYGRMGGIKEHIDSIGRPSYEKLKPRFKFGLVVYIKEECARAEKQALHLAKMLEVKYRHYNLSPTKAEQA